MKRVRRLLAAWSVLPGRTPGRLVRSFACSLLLVLSFEIRSAAAQAQVMTVEYVFGPCVPIEGGRQIPSVHPLCASSFPAVLGKLLRTQNVGLDAKVVVRLIPGLYPISEPLRFSGSIARNLSIQGPEDRSAILSGSVRIQKQMRPRDVEMAQIPASARPHIVSFDLPWAAAPYSATGFGKPSMPQPVLLQAGGIRMPLAQWPNGAYAEAAGRDRETITFNSAPRVRRPSSAQLLVAGFLAYPWAYEVLPAQVLSADDGSLVIRATGAAFNAAAKAQVRLMNQLEFIDRPGEWVLAANGRTVYFWPPDQNSLMTLEVSQATTALSFDGARDVEVSGVTLQNFRGDAFVSSEGRGVRLRNATIRNIGGRGAYVSGWDSGLQSVDMQEIGEGGVELVGGDRVTLQPAGLWVDSCSIKSVGTWSRSYRPAVAVSGVGNRVSRSSISGLPHSAIIFNGNDHVIEKNDISRTNLETQDSGAIYTGRDWSAQGTRIIGNYLHAIGKKGDFVMGIYLDDQASGISVVGNLFEDVRQPLFVGGGRSNTFERNVMIRSSPALYLDARGLDWQADMVRPSGFLVTTLKKLPYAGANYKRYKHLASILEDEPGAPKYNVFLENVLVNSASPHIEAKARPYVRLAPGADSRNRLVGSSFLATDMPGLRDILKSSDYPEFRQLEAFIIER